VRAGHDAWPKLPPARDDCALFLDVDGSLLDIAQTPGEVAVGSDLIGLLTEAQYVFGGALALLSGRTIDDLDRLFHPLRLPCAGVHGSERRSACGRRWDLDPDRAFLEFARPVLKDVARRHEGVLLEDKRVALALHTRKARAARREAASVALSLAEGSAGSFVLQWGKEVFELKPAAADKGSALAAFMSEEPFLGRRPVVTGDDATDADAFRCAASLDGISIAVGSDAPAAMYRLPNPATCRDWLRQWIT
jgi:trehalose 6-phosphate phosphatase